MPHQPTSKSAPSAHLANLFGFYSAILTTLLTLATFGIAIFTPPLSGPFCTGPCFEYPFAEIASRFPRDYYWMYPAMLLSLVYLALNAAIHQTAPVEKKVFSQLGFAFAAISAAVLVIDYFVQVSVIPPSLANGETDGIALLTQFNPHGIFIALEEVGFVMMSLAFLLMAPVFARPNRIEKALRWIFISSFALTLLSLAMISVQYGILREYRFEVAAITINWLTLIVSGVLLAVVFRRAAR